MVGGGMTGSELVAEVATDFPNAKYTLVNKPELLLRESLFLHIIFVIPFQFNYVYLYLTQEHQPMCVTFLRRIG